VGLVRDWRRQVARVAGVSLIGPLALLLAGALVASGGGLGGLGSLGQIATGPPIPDTGLAVAPDVSVEGPAAGGADATLAADPVAAAAGATGTPTGAGAPGATGPTPVADDPGTGVPPPSSGPPGPGATPAPGAPGPQAPAPAPGGGTDAPAAPAPAPAPLPAPVPDVLEGAREIIETLTGPGIPTP
jgi:hypothetical protein